MTDQAGKKKNGLAAAIAAAVIAIASLFIAPWEGRELKPYRDIVGVPTVCYGHTGKDVQIGQPRRLPAECDRLLQGDLMLAQAAVRSCINWPLPVKTEAALVSFVFNVGPGGVCGSTLQRHFNRGEIAQGCLQLTRWVNAGGKRVPGLVNRRNAEYKLCMEGFK